MPEECALPLTLTAPCPAAKNKIEIRAHSGLPAILHVIDLADVETRRYSTRTVANLLTNRFVVLLVASPDGCGGRLILTAHANTQRRTSMSSRVSVACKPC